MKTSQSKVEEKINNKLNNMEDIKRLEKIVEILSSLEEIYYHMDMEEYERMKKYIYSRFGISLQLNNPSIK